MTEDETVPLVTFQLKEKNQILQEVKRPVFKMEIKTLYRNKPPKIEPFNFSHAMAVFKLPEDNENRNLWITVLSPKGNEIYSASISQETKGKVEETNKDLIDAIQ